ncbi:cyclic AMP-responsive element-binding protein 5-like [Polyodon spathula]|uniref:cyclic AMP-responsive element-binding protein 5-like n=1 Tax=Polyodon spathula TaxID=7913 RepID=UPI001B7E8D77|nr:cyclic AMP-responsive element-binding protein 5-like [Polyodon spathula]XP_041102314.1 cyclic AMP-responsive element-binding protein 5-like [Polyodon spathula]
MNLEQERPFVCNAPGCSQRFPTEDHLMIHRHKHEMTLKFPSIKNDNMLSDQTPTPTRFLKNCEEVGIFNELDCSIEQEFRKAQEEEDNKRNISMHSSAGPSSHQPPHTRMTNHDTSIVIQQAMPSPQSSSVITQAPSTNRQIGPVPGSLSSLLHLRNRQRQPLPASMPGPLPDPTMPGSSAVLMPMERQMSMGSNMMGMQGPNLSNSCASPQVPTMHSEAKLRLKAALSHHPATMPNGNMNSMGHMMEMMSARQEQAAHHHMHSHPHQHPSLQPLHHAYQQHHHHAHPPPQHQHQHQHQQQQQQQQSHPHHHSHPPPHLHHHQTSPHQQIQSQVSPAAQQIQASQTLQSPQPTGGRRRRVVDEDPDERRRKFLERNRAAATRCRQKRKVWVISLEKKAEELTQTNMQLQNEVTMLKTEVTQLKQLLLTHKDCPITAMQKESQGYLSPESSPPGSPAPVCSQQQVIQHNTITTSTAAISEAVGNSALNQLANHRTDMNPIL